VNILPISIQKYLLLILISIIWGGQFSLNKILLTTRMDILWLAFFRILLGCISLIVLLEFFKKAEGYQEKVQYRIRDIFLFLLIGGLESVLPLNLMLWGQQYIPSNLTGILISTVPIWVIVLSMVTQAKSLQKPDLISVILGFIGILILFLDGGGFSENFHWKYAMALVLTAISFASSILLIDRTLSRFSSLIATRNILLSASFLSLCMIIIQGKAFSLSFADFTSSAWIALFLAGVVCTGLVWLAYTKLIRVAGATFTSMANYLTPLVSIILGMWLFQEPMRAHHYLGVGLIIGALCLRPFLQKVYSPKKA
jgi:drug/metabolite transporter (DMT)-like permease